MTRQRHKPGPDPWKPTQADRMRLANVSAAAAERRIDRDAALAEACRAAISGGATRNAVADAAGISRMALWRLLNRDADASPD